MQYTWRPAFVVEDQNGHIVTTVFTNTEAANITQALNNNLYCWRCGRVLRPEQAVTEPDGKVYCHICIKS